MNPSTTIAGALLLAAAASAPVVAQGDQQRCVQGAPAFAASDSPMLHQSLRRLAWASAYSDYVRIQSTESPLAAFDSIASRSAALLKLANVDASSLGAVAASLQQRMLEARREVAEKTQKGALAIDPGETVNSAQFKPEAHPMIPGRVTIRGLNIEFSDSTRVAAIAVCAAAHTAGRFLEYLMEPGLAAIARRYEASATRWKLFVTKAHSMTLVERLGASCRLAWLSYVISPVARCNWSDASSLDPPTHQWLFAHPLSGLAPVGRGDTLYRTAIVAQWYGYLNHRYTTAGMSSWGIAFATLHPQLGQPLIGGVAHTPWLGAGVFSRKSERPVYVLSADILGWIPSVRSALGDLRTDWLRQASARLAAPR